MEEHAQSRPPALSKRRPSPIPPAYQDAKELTDAILQAAWSKNAFETCVLDISKIADFASRFVILSGRSDRHVLAIADAIEAAMKERGVLPVGVEGRRAGTWVLMDYGDVIVHLFERDTRTFYDLERLWSDAEPVAVTEPQWVQDFARMEAGTF